MTEQHVVVVGSSNTDMVARLNRMPDPGETVLANDFMKAPGGKGANQAVAAARLGANVTFVARVGDDIFGNEAIENFKQEGIRVRYVTRDKNEPSGVALIFVDENGENSIAVASGANDALSREDIKRAKPAFKKAAVVLFQLETPIESVTFGAELANDYEANVVLNPAPAQELTNDLLQNVSILTPNESEASCLTDVQVTGLKSAEQAAHQLRNRGVNSVVITLGDEGALMATSEEVRHLPGHEVNPEDTTAAGDAFNGALSCALSEGQSLSDAVEFANRVGALATRTRGAQPSLPQRNEVEQFSPGTER